MGSTWRKVKIALGLNLCVNVPRTLDDASLLDDATGRSPDAVVASMASASLQLRHSAPMTPTPTSSGLVLSKNGSRSSKRTCAICLGRMKPGNGHALFTAECSHTFHFHCIASNVKHGNHVCPVCRAKWKEIPFRGPPSFVLPHARARVNRVNCTQEDGYMHILRRSPRADSFNRHHNFQPLFHASEPISFDDDEPLDSNKSDTAKDPKHGIVKTAEIRTHPEFAAIQRTSSLENFSVLIHLKAPVLECEASFSASQTSRAPVDLVTVLDVSGSMSGTKLALLKRAMGFVIQNLGPSDRLSVVAFSSTASRLFHLRRMSDSGRQQALQAVNSLVSRGGTNIAEGLRKGAKVIEERREKNSVCSIILLSDGQDTYTVSSGSGHSHLARPDYQSLLPSSIRGGIGLQIPVHAFGFGADHDSASMHSISEASGGTFSFIEAEGVIQDAFAQCIGGLLSVIVQEMRVEVECLHPGTRLGLIKSGSYASHVVDNRRTGSIEVGDLYADEERNFLVSVNVPAGGSDDGFEETGLLKVGCSYRDPVSNESVTMEVKEVKVQRPDVVTGQTMSIEVNRQVKRLQAAEAMAEARTAAERGALSEAVCILENCRRSLAEMVAERSGDGLCTSLDAELREMQERMASRQRYESSGRAYVLSGLSSHAWQRATARGDSTDSMSLVQAYQTPSMVDMLQRSQTLNPSRRSFPSLRPALSFPARALPRGDEVAGRSISYYRSLLLGAVGRGGGATSSSAPHQGPKLHATLLKTGILPTTTSISNALFHMYAACGPSSSALQAFQETPRPHRSVIDWTALLSCHSRRGLPSETLRLFRTMELEDGLVGDEVTMVCVLGACARLRDAVAGAAAHLRIIKSGLPFTVAARNAAMDMYAKCGMMGHAWELFDEMMTPTIVSWTVILTGALRWEGLNSGRQVFDRMGKKNEISWTVMVSAYVEAGLPREALSLLAQMLSQQHHDIDQNGEVAGVVSLNHVTLCSLLSACSQASDLTVARWVHAYSTRMTSTVLMGDTEDHHHHQKLMVGTALIDVYAKCGKIDTARLLFEKMPQRNVVAWNAMLSGLAMHGLGSDVLCLFSRMVSNGFDPDEITLVSVLSACSRSGLVDEGRKCFLELEAVYGVTPTVEHYACAVDLLGRAGHLGEAESLVRKMPMRPNEVVLGSLLASCCLHGELALGRQLMEDLVRVDPLNTEYHILLSNMYASAGNQAEAVSFREVLRKRGVRKVPGMSYIKIHGYVHRFSSGDKSHPRTQEVYAMLDEMVRRLRVAGYVPNTAAFFGNNAASGQEEMEEEEREQSLLSHSERLAIAFGLISTKPGASLCIFKNLRICRDCHSVVKLISDIFEREITIRDRNRFHHFKLGSCSCSDYW